jgi:hypothetical protein
MLLPEDAPEFKEPDPKEWNLKDRVKSAEQAALRVAFQRGARLARSTITPLMANRIPL